MAITILREVHGDLREQLWKLYHDQFADLNTTTIQRHLMYREEFDVVMGDARVEKYISHQPVPGQFGFGEITGLATFSNQLQAMPLISPQFFQRHYPDLCARGAVFYCGFVCTTGGDLTTFTELVTAMYREAERVGGLISLDMSRATNDGLHMGRRVALLLRRLSSGKVRTSEGDVQTYWLYHTDPPAAIAPDLVVLDAFEVDHTLGELLGEPVVPATAPVKDSTAAVKD